jgi:hypothetical protein
VQSPDNTRVRRGEFDGGLGRLHLDDDLVDLHGVAHPHGPLENLGLGEALADIGQQEDLLFRHGDPLLL